MLFGVYKGKNAKHGCHAQQPVRRSIIVARGARFIHKNRNPNLFELHHEAHQQNERFRCRLFPNGLSRVSKRRLFIDHHCRKKTACYELPHRFLSVAL